MKKKMCKCVNAICVDGRRGPLVDQDLCNLHIICVNLHKFLHQAVEKMCKCVNAICEMCFRYAPLPHTREVVGVKDSLEETRNEFWGSGGIINKSRIIY